MGNSRLEIAERQAIKEIDDFFKRKLMYQFRKGSYPASIKDAVKSAVVSFKSAVESVKDEEINSLKTELKLCNKSHDNLMKIKNNAVQDAENLAGAIDVLNSKASGSLFSRLAYLFTGKL